MVEWIESLHWAWAIAFFWVVGIVRTSVVFSLGWLASAGTSHFDKVRRAMGSPVYLRAQAFINRWGVLAVPLCFLTLGFQTAVIITTGFTRMPLFRWIPAMLCGTLMWGCIYGTVGMAVISAWLFEPRVIGVLLVVLAAVVITLHFYHRKRAHKL